MVLKSNEQYVYEKQNVMAIGFDAPNSLALIKFSDGSKKWVRAELLKAKALNSRD